MNERPKPIAADCNLCIDYMHLSVALIKPEPIGYVPIYVEVLAKDAPQRNTTLSTFLVTLKHVRVSRGVYIVQN